MGKTHGGKQKTHSGAKKRFKVRNSGSVKVAKAARRHLLTGKGQSRSEHEMPVHPTRMKALRRKLPGKIQVANNGMEVANDDQEVKKEEKNAA